MNNINGPADINYFVSQGIYSGLFWHLNLELLFDNGQWSNTVVWRSYSEQNLRMHSVYAILEQPSYIQSG